MGSQAVRVGAMGASSKHGKDAKISVVCVDRSKRKTRRAHSLNQGYVHILRCGT